MPFATGARHELSYVAESVFGTTPATPTMKRVRNTGVDINVTKETFTSDEIRGDRQISDMRHGVRQVGGTIDFELSYGAFDELFEGALFGAWATNVLKAGGTAKSFTMERRFGDVTQFQPFVGCMINTMSLALRPNAMVTGSFGVIGKSMTPSGSSLDATIDDVATNPPFDAFSGAILEGGVAIASVTSLDLNLDNGLTPAFVIGSATMPEIIAGRSNLTGTLTAYFETGVLLAKFLDETESSLSVTLDGAAGGDLTILLPRIKYSGGSLPASSSDEGILVTMPFQALRDPTEETNIKLTRTPAS